jgi:hypothetical protein
MLKKYFFNTILKRLVKFQIIQTFISVTTKKKNLIVNNYNFNSVKDGLTLSFTGKLSASLRIKGFCQAICCLTVLFFNYVLNLQLVKNSKKVFHLKLFLRVIILIYSLVGGDICTSELLSYCSFER